MRLTAPEIQLPEDAEGSLIATSFEIDCFAEEAAAHVEQGTRTSIVLSAPVIEIPAVSLELLLQRVGGNSNLLSQLLNTFHQQSREQLEKIEKSIEEQDAKTLERSAHTLKGIVSFFGVEAAIAAALNLEGMGREGDFTTAQAAYQTLTEELRFLTKAVETIEEELTK